MQFLNCPVCGRPMTEEPEKSEFHFRCSSCNRQYLYEEGTLIDLGASEPSSSDKSR